MLNNKAFTLTECLIVIVLVAVLAVTGARYARENIKMAAMNEGRVLINHIIAKEKNYFAEHYVFLTTGNAKKTKIDIQGPDKKTVEIIDISVMGDYFNSFKIEEKKTVSGEFTNITLIVELYPNREKYPDFSGKMYIRGTYNAQTNEIKYEENYG